MKRTLTQALVNWLNWYLFRYFHFEIILFSTLEDLIHIANPYVTKGKNS